MSRIRNVLLVGHCGFDSMQLRQTVQRIAGDDIDVSEASRADDVRNAGPDTLLLINRQLGMGFGTGAGVELIRELADKADPPAMMLISNHADAQAQAVEAGGLPGFGKAELDDPETEKRLRQVLHENADKS